jgi:hypothetical protein
MIMATTILIVAVIAMINNRISIAKLEKEQERITKELDQKEAIYQKRVKDHNELVEKNHKQIEEYKKDIEKQRLSLN